MSSLFTAATSARLLKRRSAIITIVKEVSEPRVIICSTSGLEDKLVQLLGEVHHGLLSIGFDDFREHLSDHIPVTVRVLVAADDD